VPWLQLSFDAAHYDPDWLGDQLSAAGAVSVTLQDAADQPVYEPPPGATPLWSHTRVVGLFDADADLAEVQSILRAALGRDDLPGCRIETLEDRDWVRAWMDDFHPMRFGARLWVCPSNQAPPEPQAVNILLDPGLAFGTGTHPTTALCLEWLDAHAPLAADVVDYGCGSGILAIAAALLGAREVQAVDIDPQALLATAQNAHANGVDAAIKVHAPDRLPARHYNLILANILAGPLQELAARFAGLLRPGGAVVLAGLLEAQADEVAQAYAPWFDLEPKAVRAGWARLVGRRKAS
jgi:ribosomal protein L11 methyltransferase